MTLEATATGGVPASLAAVLAFLSAAAVSDDIDLAPTLVNDAPVFFPLGVTTVHFTGRDASGNVTIRSATVTVVDTTAPAVAITSPVAYVTLSGHTAHVTGTATDLNFGRWALSLDGLANPFAQGLFGGAIEGDFDPFTLADGPHQVWLLALDTRDNSAIAKVQVFIQNGVTPYLQVTVHSPVHIWITDAQGRHLGYNPANVPAGVVNTLYSYGAYVAADELASPPIFESAYITYPLTAGDYLVELVGVATGTYTVDFTFASFDVLGVEHFVTQSFTGDATPGSLAAFDVAYPTGAARLSHASTHLTYTGPTTAGANDSTRLTATLIVDLGLGTAPLAGRAIHFTVAGTTYTGITDSSGSAGVWVEFTAGDIASPVWVGVYWDSGQPPEMDSSSTSATVNVIADETSTAFTTSMPTFAYVGQDFTAVARVSDPAGAPQPGDACAAVVPTPAWCQVVFNLVNAANAVVATATGMLDASGIAHGIFGAMNFADGSYRLLASFGGGL